MNIQERWEWQRIQAIEDFLKKAREELIRKNASKIIFEKFTNQIVNFAFN